MPESGCVSVAGGRGSVSSKLDTAGFMFVILSLLLRSERLEALCLLRGLFDGAHVHERLLGEMIPLALEQLFEAAHRISHRDVFAGVPVNTSATLNGWLK